jgi:hypothetical protein
MKTAGNSRLSPGTTYQGTVIIPYAEGISVKFRRIRNRFNVRIVFKTKHSLRGTLMKAVSVADAQQTDQWVYNVPCDCGRCQIGETSRPLEVGIKEHENNGTQSLLEKNQISPTCLRRRPQNMLERSEGFANGAEHHLQEIQGIRSHVSGCSYDQSTQFRRGTR